MKLSKARLLVIAAAVLLLALAMVWRSYSQRAEERSQLDQQLSKVQLSLQRVKLETLSGQKAELEKRLDQAKAQFEAVKAGLSEPSEDIDVVGIVFRIARAPGVEITAITLAAPVEGSLGGVTGSVTSLSLNVAGDVPGLVSFVTAVNNAFVAGVIKSVVVAIPESTSKDKASASIELVVYSFPGS